MARHRGMKEFSRTLEERKTRFRFTMKNTKTGEVTNMMVHAINVAHAILLGDNWANEHWPGAGVLFTIYRNAMPEGGYTLYS